MLLSLLLAGARCGPSEDPCVASLEASRLLLDQQRYDDAIGAVETLIGTPCEGDGRYVAGLAHLRAGRYDRAVEALQAAANVQVAAGDSQGAAKSHYAAAYSFGSRNQYRRAIEHAAQSLAHAEDAGDSTLAPQVANNLAVYFRHIGDLRAARWAIDLGKELADPDDGNAHARLSESEGLLYYARGNYSLARVAHERSLELGAELGDSFLGAVHLNLVRTHLELDDHSRARVHLERAREHTDAGRFGLRYYTARLLEETGESKPALEIYEGLLGDESVEPEFRWEIHERSGRIALALGDPEQAKSGFMEAIEIVEAMREEARFDSFQSWLLAKKRRPYESLLRLQAAASDPLGALETIERVKARALEESIVSRTLEEDTGDSVVTSEREALKRLAVLEAVIPDLQHRSSREQSSIEQRLSSLGARNMLVYFQAGEEIWRTTIVKGRVEIQRLAAEVDPLQTEIRRLLDDPADPELAERLGRALLPATAALPPGPRLFISPDGILNDLPFAALRRDGRLLVEDHELAYVPSLGALAAIESSRKRGSGARVILGDPNLDLPSATAEAETVGELIGAHPLLGSSADSQSLLDSQTAALLHVAAHSGVDSGGSWIGLADRRVHAATVISREISPNVVFLASCSSAVADNPGVWGSLGSAFLAAGSDAVVATLWSVDDRATREFVLDFYKENGATDPIGAVARVQRTWARRGAPAQHWTPYITLGSK